MIITRRTRCLGVYCGNSLRQQCMVRHVVPFRHIIRSTIQPVFALILDLHCTPRGETTNIFHILGSTSSEIEDTFYIIRGDHANNYTYDEVHCIMKWITLNKNVRKKVNNVTFVCKYLYDSYRDGYFQSNYN